MYKFGFGIFAEHYVLLKIFSHWLHKESSQQDFDTDTPENKQEVRTSFWELLRSCLYQGFRRPVTQGIRGGRKMGIFVKLFEDNTHLLCVI